MNSSSTIKEQVRDRYGSIAEQHLNPTTAAPLELLDVRPQADAGCCGTVGCCSPDTSAQDVSLAQALYNEADVAGLPDSVTLASLGCGNPTAIASLKPGETVLDLGSGGGIDCFISARFVGPTGRVIGVDMTDRMLSLANQNKAKLNLTNVEFRKGEIEDLPVESETVDVNISNCVINLSPDKDAVFREALRVLKPGGRFAVSDMVTEGEWSEQLKANVGAWAGCITGAIDQDDYLQKMRAVGFTDVEIESRSSYGLEDLDSLDETSREVLTQDIDWPTVPTNVRLYSARVVAHKPEA
jgi:SAM-dependent methyltransferase